MTTSITAILMSWKRKPNMPKIIEAIRGQSVPVEIWLVNCNGLEDFGADKLIAMPWGPGEWARYGMLGRVKSKYCMFQDDDFMMGDKFFLEDALGIHCIRCPDNMLGVAGRGLQQTSPHYWPDIVNQDGYASILKGHFQLFKSEVVRRARMSHHISSGDIYWSLDVGAGRPVHWVSKELSQRFAPLDQFGVGYELRPGHWDEREAVCVDWLKEWERLYA